SNQPRRCHAETTQQRKGGECNLSRSEAAFDLGLELLVEELVAGDELFCEDGSGASAPRRKSAWV
ncbi:MAG: hypothetical protein OXI97_16930, partial [Acidimicrobiaceae bacterium]|nr:hypothetical protein [Acidimicrobiaceae bacterium]